MFFFFKQKTAYEMRISDRSSDVCSSDLDLKELPKEKQLSDFDDKQLGKLAKLMKIDVSVLKEQRDMWNSTASDTAEATEAVDVADVATAEAAADAAEAAADSAVAVAATEYDRRNWSEADRHRVHALRAAHLEATAEPSPNATPPTPRPN